MTNPDGSIREGRHPDRCAEEMYGQRCQKDQDHMGFHEVIADLAMSQVTIHWAQGIREGQVLGIDTTVGRIR